MNIAAYTSPEPNYPSYISVNASDAGVEITIREQAAADGTCGRTVSILLDNKAFSNFRLQIATHSEQFEGGVV